MEIEARVFRSLHRRAGGPGSAKCSLDRSGLTVIELLAALVLLAVAMGLVGTVQQRLSQGIRQIDVGQRIEWELENLEQRIRGWNRRDVNQQKILQQSIGQAIERLVDDASWIAEVEQIDEPVRAIQVTLAVQGKLHDQPFTSRRHTFWLSREDEQ